MPCWNQFPNPIPETSSENGSRSRPSEPVPDRLPEQLLETDTGDSLALGAYASLQPGHIAWWTGRDLNPRPYGAGLVPSRKQGPSRPAKRAIFGLTLSVYQADLPAHEKAHTIQGC